MAAFAGMRVEAGNEDIRVFHAEFAAQILRENGGHRFNQRPVDGGGDVFKREVGLSPAAWRTAAAPLPAVPKLPPRSQEMYV